MHLLPSQMTITRADGTKVHLAGVTAHMGTITCDKYNKTASFNLEFDTMTVLPAEGLSWWGKLKLKLKPFLDRFGRISKYWDFQIHLLLPLLKIQTVAMSYLWHQRVFQYFLIEVALWKWNFHFRIGRKD